MKYLRNEDTNEEPEQNSLLLSFKQSKRFY